MGFWAIAGPAIASAVLGQFTKSKTKAPKAVKESAATENALKGKQLELGELIANLILNKGSIEGMQFPKVGGGLGQEQLGQLASSTPLSALLSIPGLFSTGSPATGALAGLQGQSNALNANAEGALGNSLARAIALAFLTKGQGEGQTNPVSEAINGVEITPTGPVQLPTV